MVAIDDIGLAAGSAPGPGSGSRAGSASAAASRPVSDSWTAWGVTATVTVTDPRALAPARRLAARQILAAEAAASRLRRNAEITRLYRAGGRAITVSPLLAGLVSAALITAERTGGDVDPTVNAALTALTSHPRRTAPLPVCATRTTGGRPAPGWEQVHLQGRRLQVPAGVTLDLTATAKAVAVDRAAAQVADRLRVGVLVQLGSDAATAGPAPQDGWTVPIHGRDDGLQTLVTLPAGAAVSTSHATTRVEYDVHALRTGRAPGIHLIDPRTGLPPAAVWQQVSVLGFTAREAAAYAAASLVRGTGARSWLVQLGVPARLVTTGGDVIAAGSWAAHQTTSEPTLPGPRLATPRRTTL